MVTLEMLFKKKSTVESQIKRVCEQKEKADLVFLQAELAQVELQILEKEVDAVDKGKYDKNGWHDIPARLKWKCPECNEWSPYDAWEETIVGCEDCGEHDARECPVCNEVFDIVWGAARIAKAMRMVKDVGHANVFIKKND
jgi:hypothetical protein